MDISSIIIEVLITTFGLGALGLIGFIGKQLWSRWDKMCTTIEDVVTDMKDLHRTDQVLRERTHTHANEIQVLKGRVDNIESKVS